MDETFLWQTTPTGVRFGEQSTGATFSLSKEAKGIFSTNSDINMVAESESEAFFSKLLNNQDYTFENGMYFMEFATPILSVALLVDGHWLVTSNSDMFLLDIKSPSDRNSCALAF